MKNQEWTPTCLFLSIFLFYSGWWIIHVINLFNKLHLYHSMSQISAAAPGVCTCHVGWCELWYQQKKTQRRQNFSMVTLLRTHRSGSDRHTQCASSQPLIVHKPNTMRYRPLLDKSQYTNIQHSSPLNSKKQFYFSNQQNLRGKHCPNTRQFSIFFNKVHF